VHQIALNSLSDVGLYGQEMSVLKSQYTTDLEVGALVLAETVNGCMRPVGARASKYGGDLDPDFRRAGKL